MARGDYFAFNEFPKNVGNKLYDLDADTFSARLVTSLPAKTLATPNIADVTECSTGGGYTSGGITLAGLSLTTSGVYTDFKSTTNPSWSPAAGSPTNIKALVVVHNATGDLITCVDLTTDGGTTAISLVDGPVGCTWSANIIVRFAA